MLFRRFIIVVAIILSSNVGAQGQQPPDSTMLDTIDYQCAGPPLEYHCNTPGWHLDYIGMPEVWNTLDLFGDWENGAGPVTSFSIGIYDESFSRETSNYPHEFIDFSVLESVDGNSGYGVGRKTAHGNMVAAAVSAGKLGENFPTRPMIRAKTVTYSYGKRDGTSIESADEFQVLLNHADKPKIIGASVGFGYNYGNLKKYNKENNPDLSYDPIIHWKSLDGSLENEPVVRLRQIIKNNPDVLFVVSAGNNAKRANFANGMLHRQYDVLIENLVLDKLDNLIVVGSVAATGTLAKHSNFGREVDIAAPSLYLGLTCANKNGSGLRKPDITLPRPEFAFSYTERYGNDSDVNPARMAIVGKLDNLTFWVNSSCNNNKYSANGTSAAQPLVLGAAAILFHADDKLGNGDITPQEVKNLLVYGSKEKPTTGTGGLNKVTRRYVNPKAEINVEDSNGVFEDSRGDKVKDLPANQNIPILNVAYSLNQYLATIPPEPVSTYTKLSDPNQGSGLAEPIQIAELNNLNFTLSDVPTGYAPIKGGDTYSQALFVPAGNACIVITKPDSMQATITSSIGVMLDENTSATGGTCENPNQFTFQSSSTEPTLSAFSLGTAIGISSTNGFYIPYYGLNLEAAGDTSTVYAVVIDILP